MLNSTNAAPTIFQSGMTAVADRADMNAVLPPLPPRTRAEIVTVVATAKGHRAMIAMPRGMYRMIKEQAQRRNVSSYSLIQSIGVEKLVGEIDKKRRRVPEKDWMRYSLYLRKGTDMATKAEGSSASLSA